MLKLLGLFGLFAVVLAGDVIVGREGGNIIFDRNVTASPAIWTQVKNITINATDDEVISRVVITDNRPLKDGEAKIVEGGEGEKNVTIELKSPAVFRGFDFTVTVFAAQESQFQNPKTLGIDAENPQVPMNKDINVNEKKTPKNGEDIVPSSTEATKADGVTNPAAVGKDQTRLYRDTKDQTSTTTTASTTSSTTFASKDLTTENPHPTQGQQNKDFDEVVRSIFADNTTVKSEDRLVNGQVQPVTLQVQSSEPKDQKNDGPILLPKGVASTEFSTQMTTESTKSGQQLLQKHPMPIPYEYMNH